MLIVYVLLLLLYVGLTALYLFAQKKPTPVPSWPVLPPPPRDDPDLAIATTTCRRDTDCPLTHVCLGTTCVPKLLRGGKCDPAHGRWISYAMKGGAAFAICACIDDRLFTQKVFGGDCDANVACGAHGKYLPEQSSCECDKGYRAAAVGLACEKVPLLEYLKTLPCEKNELGVSSIRDEDGFHPDYLLRRLEKQKCVKRPCSFDALSGRFLKHGRYEHDWGCVCDPKYGLFGVVLEGVGKKYLSSPGFDACASIFDRDPQEPIDVKLVTYFYLEKREPVSLVLFDPRDSDLLAPAFRGRGGPFMLHQSPWRYDYAQRFFQEHPRFNARTRKIYKDSMFGIEVANEALYYSDFKPEYCNTPIRIWLNAGQDRVAAYHVLYQSPVCKMLDRDPSVFRGRVIVNPNHVTFRAFPELHRFNAFVLHFDPTDGGSGRWTLDLDYPFNVDLYRSIATNAPVYP